MTKIKTISLSKLKVLFLSLFLGFFLVGCGGAQVPEITVQPKSKIATANTTSTLQVGAQVSDGGTLFYQWYSNTKNSSEGGTAIEGANSDVFTFTVPAEGFAYYYVVITNINADTESYANVTSDVAVITVVDYDVYEVSFYDEDLKLLNVETVESGVAIRPHDYYQAPLYELASATPVGETYTVHANAALFASANVAGIKNRTDLENIASNLDGKYILEADIDLSGSDWTPIGNKAKPFTGRLSGKIYKITGLTVNVASDYAGLFGYTKGGHVVSLRLNLGSDGISGGSYVGGIAGYADKSTITAVTVRGNVKGKDYVGGIAGAVNVGTITATYSVGNVEATGNYVGGVTGYIKVGTITATFTKGDITSSNGENVGGIAGYSELSTITATFGDGKITGDKNVGGAVGYLRYGTVVAAFLHGKVYGNDNVHNIVGRNSLGLAIGNLALGWFVS